nr:MAG TPA: hypothetical protein [Caudoviricetes sp.]
MKIKAIAQDTAMPLLYHQSSISYTLGSVFFCVLRRCFRQYGLYHKHQPFHDQRQNDAITDAAPAGFLRSLCLHLFRKAIYGIFNDWHNLFQQSVGDLVFQFIGHDIDIQRINNIVSHISPFTHDFLLFNFRSIRLLDAAFIVRYTSGNCPGKVVLLFHQQLFIFIVGNEGQLNKDRRSIGISQYIETIDTGRSRFNAAVYSAQCINNLILDATCQSMTGRAARTCPCFCTLCIRISKAIAMDRDEKICTTGISLIADFFQAVTLEDVRHPYTSSLEIVSNKVTHCQCYIALTQPSIVVHRARVRIAIGCMARINKYVHLLSPPFGVEPLIVPPMYPKRPVTMLMAKLSSP